MADGQFLMIVNRICSQINHKANEENSKAQKPSRETIQSRSVEYTAWNPEVTGFPKNVLVYNILKCPLSPGLSTKPA